MFLRRGSARNWPLDGSARSDSGGEAIRWPSKARLTQSFGSAALVITLVAPARAQLEFVPVGEHVRVTMAADLSRVEGTLLANGRDSIAVATSPGVVRRLATMSISRFEVREKSRLAGAWRGALIGAPVGCLVVCGQRNELGGAAEVAGAVGVWSALGAGIGALVRANAWRSVRLPPRPVIVAESPAPTMPSARPSESGSIGPPQGTRVRLRLDPPAATVTGVVVNGTTDSLFLTTARMEQLRLSRQTLRSIEVSGGVDRGRGARRGILGTIGVAASIGAVVCAVQQRCGTEWGGHPGPGPRLVWGSLLGGAAGVALSPVGGVIGWNIGVERWMPWRR
jgi:hypothetical protein